MPKPRDGDGLVTVYVTFDALVGEKFHTQAGIRTPDDAARPLEFVVGDRENEIVRNADLAADLETGADR